MKPFVALSAIRLWAAALLVAALLGGADVLLGTLHRPEKTHVHWSWPVTTMVDHRLGCLHHSLFIILTLFVTVLADAFIAPPCRRFPNGARAAALAATTAAIALLAPLSYGVHGEYPFVALIAILLHRVRDGGP
ncbi:MAG: hypothetical protein M1574_04160 [Gammaproteobacteria bacterium]|nr:hypothetical protein [Gammaproteobacteria bacterium]